MTFSWQKLAVTNRIISIYCSCITGQIKVLQILYRFGHCISYVMHIETAQSQKSQMILAFQETSFLPLKLASSNDHALTVFWVDNLDKVNYKYIFS